MKFYGPHGESKECLASGAPIPDGEYFDLTKKEVDDPHNARLIKEGKILPATDAAADAAAQAADNDKQKEGSA